MQLTLKGIFGELLGVAPKLAASLGQLLGGDKNNEFLAAQRFYVPLCTEGGWKTQIGAWNEAIGMKEVIKVDYCNLPICYCYCLAMDYLVKDCAMFYGHVGGCGPSNEDTIPQLQPRGEQVSKDEVGGGTVISMPTPANKGSGHGERIDTNQAMENVLEEVGGEPLLEEKTVLNDYATMT